MIFRATALLLSLAFAGAPAAADYCAAACETTHTHLASSGAHAGHHHHSSTPLSSIDRAPQPCGHDHSGIVGIAGSDNAAPVRALVHASTAVTPASLHARSVSISFPDVGSANSSPGVALRGFASPLRV
jgi:hypothetical protein